MKSAIIDVGGGMRGIYAAGVMDRCMEEKIHFDIGIGVSAGSANIVSYAAGQKGRNYLFYTEYSYRKEYMSLGNLLHKKSYIDMDYIYGVLSNEGGENPLDYPAIAANPAELITVATNALTGEVKYFDKRDLSQNDYDIVKASCSIPLVCPPYMINGIPYYDGALSDPIPVEKAFSMGCDKVVLILTRPKNFRRKPGKDRLIACSIRRKYPRAAFRMEQRSDNYNALLDKAVKLEQQGRLIIIAPDDTCGMDTLTRDREVTLTDSVFTAPALNQDGNVLTVTIEEDPDWTGSETETETEPETEEESEDGSENETETETGTGSTGNGSQKGSGSGSVKTGDETPVGLSVMAGLLSLAVAAGCLVTLRRRAK